MINIELANPEASKIVIMCDDHQFSVLYANKDLYLGYE